MGVNGAFLGPKRQEYKGFRKFVDHVFSKYYVLTDILSGIQN